MNMPTNLREWLLLRSDDASDDEDIGGDQHSQFMRSVDAFRRKLLQQFQDDDEGGGEDQEGESAEEAESVTRRSASGAARSALSVGEEAYLARFVQPYPAQPMWEAMRDRPGREEDYYVPPLRDGGAPRVCVVLNGSEEMRWEANAAICRLAAHPAGLVVTVKPMTPKVGKHGGPLLFVSVGLWLWQSDDRLHQERSVMNFLDSMGFLSDDQVLSVAEQRQIVWAAVHEALGGTIDEARMHALPRVAIDVYMLQDMWLYDRLFHWLSKQQVTCWYPRVFWREELDLFVHEFGEEIATHFLFVERYSRHLFAAGCVTLACTVASHCFQRNFFGPSGNFRDLPVPAKLPWFFLAAFMPAWAFHFLASWRAAATRAGFRWLGSIGSVQNSMKETARLQASETKSQKRARYFRVLAASVPLMLTQLLVVLTVTVTFVVVEVYLYDVLWETLSYGMRLLGAFLYNLAFGIGFMLILGVFYPISKWVTQWERHPDPELVRWHHISKIFANWFLAIFLYFFIIGFIYIPFGDDIAEFFAMVSPERLTHGGGARVHLVGNESAVSKQVEESAHTVRHALEEFSPDIHRLALDVCLFFVLQDSLRLLHVLVPAISAAWGLRHDTREGLPSSGAPRHKRTAIVSGAKGLCEVWLSREPKGLLPGQGQELEEGVLVAFLSVESLEVHLSRPGEAKERVVRITCGHRQPPKPSNAFQAWEGSGAVSSRLRICHASDRRPDVLEEDTNLMLADLMTVVMDPSSAQNQVQLHVSAVLLDSSRGMQSELQSFAASLELKKLEPLLPEPGGGLAASSLQRSTLRLGPVMLYYTAGLIRAPTHVEALDKVAEVLRLQAEINGLEDGLQRPGSNSAIASLPWVWWDQQLASLHWDQVLELFAVKETFETFELYAHLTTQFSYVCLFSMVVPFCPLLAMIFTSVEARQDQLRLLWLSRAPKPPDNSLRFDWQVSLGAWKDILQFICHLSVVVNLLLCGLTYEGLGGTRPADWGQREWWRALGLLLLIEKGFTFLTWVLGHYVSQLDHKTATAYLRREDRLKKVLARLRQKEHDYPTANPNSISYSPRISQAEASRERLGRSAASKVFPSEM